MQTDADQAPPSATEPDAQAAEEPSSDQPPSDQEPPETEVQEEQAHEEQLEKQQAEEEKGKDGEQVQAEGPAPAEIPEPTERKFSLRIAGNRHDASNLWYRHSLI